MRTNTAPPSKPRVADAVGDDVRRRGVSRNSRRFCAFAAPFVRRATGPEALALARGRRRRAAAQTFVYAVGFYVSSGARLSRGARPYVLYLLLFAATLALVPLFSLFELSAIVASPLFAARRGAEARGRGLRRRFLAAAAARSAGSASSSGSMIGSDGEVRRWRGGGKSRRRGGGRRGMGPSLPGNGVPERVEPKSSKSFRTSPSSSAPPAASDGGDDDGGDRGGSAAAFLPKRSRRRAEAARRIRESAFGAVRREQPRGPLAERARDEESVTLYK